MSRMFVGARRGLRRNDKRRGYTLLELLISLALTLVVMGIIANSIRLYMVTMSKHQAAIERRIVARAVLDMIRNDLRAAMQYKDNDYSGLNDLLKTQQAITGAANGAEEEEEEEEEDEDPVADEDAVAYRPSLIGTSNALILDINRLPRLDQYNPFVDSTMDAVSTPSDVKSVTYYASMSGGGMQDNLEFAEARAPGGLYRREIDRAVAEYRGDARLSFSPDKFTQLVAPEIAEIRFSYFDGEDWRAEWNSADDNGFPLAVRIELVIDPQRAVETTGYQYSGFDRENMERFSLTVHLPLAEIIQVAE